MAKRTSAGGRFIKNERAKLNREDVVCTNHVKRESELVRLPSGAVKRTKKR